MKKRLKKDISLFLFLIFISGCLFFLDRGGKIRKLRGIVEQPILELEKKVYLLNNSLNQWFKILKLSKKKDQEILRLQDQLRQLAVEQNQLATCLEENREIRRLLGAPLSPRWKFLPADVIAVSEQMKINKGEKEGVKKGMMVVSENILVGQVVSVGERTSLVQLPIDPKVKMSVVVKRPARPPAGVQARGLLKGQSGGNLILERILQNEDIQKGDLITTSDNLLIGQIEEIISKPAELYQKAKVKPLVDYHNLRIVFVVTNDWNH